MGHTILGGGAWEHLRACGGLGFGKCLREGHQRTWSSQATSFVRAVFTMVSSCMALNRESSKPYIGVSVVNVTCQGLLDTGSAFNLLSTRMYEKVKHNVNTRILATPSLKLRSASGDRIKLLARIVCPVTIGSKTVRTEFLVVPNSNGVQTLLGTDFMSQAGINLDVRNRQVRVSSEEYGNGGCGNLPMKIPAKHETHGFVRAPGSCKVGQEVLILESKAPEGVLVMEGITEVVQHGGEALVPIVVCNTNPHPIACPRDSVRVHVNQKKDYTVFSVSQSGDPLLKPQTTKEQMLICHVYHRSTISRFWTCSMNIRTFSPGQTWTLANATWSPISCL